MSKCIIEGCPNEGVHSIGIRCRRPQTTAIWAPNTKACLCHEHAESGCIIDIIFTPTDTGVIETNVSSGSRLVAKTFPIKHKANE